MDDWLRPCRASASRLQLLLFYVEPRRGGLFHELLVSERQVRLARHRLARGLTYEMLLVNQMNSLMLIADRHADSLLPHLGRRDGIVRRGHA